MNDEFLKILAIILGGGGFGAFLTYKLRNRKQDSSEFENIVGEYKALVEDYKKEVVQLRKDVNELKNILHEKHDEVVNLRNQLMIFESSHVDIPIPIWLKDTNGVMLFLNEEYERKLLHPIGKTIEDYLGKRDVDVWGAETGKNFTDNDKKVMREKKPIQFTEKWKGLNGDIYEGVLIKYPRFLNNRTVIGIGGLIMNIQKVKKTQK